MATSRKPARRPASPKAPPKSKAREKSPPRRAALTPAEAAAADDDKAWLAGIKETLLQRRRAITSVVQSSREHLASNEGDPSDIADRASDGFEDELTAGLLSLEAAQLEEIDAALERIERGRYGICIDCEKPIPRKRLEILPFAKRCLKCESGKEQAARMASFADDESEENEFD